MMTNEAILEIVAENVRKELNERGVFLNEFYNRLYKRVDSMYMNNLNNSSGHQSKFQAYLGAMEFENMAANSVVITDMFKQGIDDFFDNNRFHENGNELAAQRRKLKDLVEEKLALHPETEEGKRFIEDLHHEFHVAVTSTGERRVRERMEFMEDFTRPLNTIIKRSLESEDEKSMFRNMPIILTNDVKALAFSGLEDAKALANERQIISHSINDIVMSIDSNESVMPHEFLKHFHEKNFVPTQKESEWINEIFERITDGKSIPWERFMYNRKPIFSEKHLNLLPTKQDYFKSVIIGNLLDENPISILQDDGTLELISPRIVDAREEHKNFINKIIDFFKGMLGIGKQKEEKLNRDIVSMQASMRNMRERIEDSVTVMPREQISLEDFMGMDTLKKVVPTTQKKAPEKSKNTLTLGM